VLLINGLEIILIICILQAASNYFSFFYTENVILVCPIKITMDKTQVLQLLSNIKYHRYVGITEFEVVRYAVSAGLLIRTAHGNFELSPKGEDLLNNNILWDDITK
jgi:hypothetical protein